MAQVELPRLAIAGLAGDSGKTLVALGLLALARERGLAPVAFKKGPDYIDAAWLALAAASPCHNLDLFLQPPAQILASFGRHASRTLSLIEGNRGLLDGLDLEGSCSTAALARLLRTPVVLVVNAAKVTRTVAASVLGCRQLEPEVAIRGVVLNQVGGARHAAIARAAVEELAGVPVLGVLPRVRHELLPERHLGLVPPEEHPRAAAIRSELGRLVAEHLDLGRLLAVAREAPGLELPATPDRPGAVGARVRIGVFRDSAFTFYYPENLEALEAAGAELVPISPLAARALPDLDALYIGGGFPETHAERLAEGRALHAELRALVERGLPVYAECGGLIFLARSLRAGERSFPMAGVLGLDLELCARPQGHGYVELRADRACAFFRAGSELRGHEFHYTRIVGGAPPADVETAFEVRRGVGCGGGRDGIVHHNVLASYTHLHALGSPDWAAAVVRAAAGYSGSRSD
jgi:cobyrinic acid a,c-diamide synthase